VAKSEDLVLRSLEIDSRSVISDRYLLVAERDADRHCRLHIPSCEEAMEIFCRGKGISQWPHRGINGIVRQIYDGVSEAQPRTMSEKNNGGIIFKAVSELNQETSTPKLGNAETADPTKWMASFYSGSGNFECTSTLIGPQTLLTAAHCVGNGKKASIVLAGKTYSGPCTQHTDYPGDASADYALCLFTEPRSL
jgi:hypothetical protein